MRKIGIYGGCFNPVHNGHLRLAIECLETLSLDTVHFLPTPRPPHKEEAGILSYELRCSLVQTAISQAPALELSRAEEEIEGPSYTAKTLELYRGKFPDDELWLLMGGTDLLSLDIWHKGLTFPSVANLAVVTRGDKGLAEAAYFIARFWPAAERRSKTCWVFPTSGTRLEFIDIPILDISASDIRDIWLNGRNPAGLLPDSCLTLLKEQRAVVEQSWHSGTAEPSDAAEYWPLRKVVSGGQTGVDRAGLDAAMEAGLETGGWCPRGRRAEDGSIPERYNLKETDSANYVIRTEMNVHDSDGTLILNQGRLESGTLKTLEYARQRHIRTVRTTSHYHVVDLDLADSVAETIRRWIREKNITTLNIAGPRESKRPGVYDKALALLREVFGKS